MANINIYILVSRHQEQWMQQYEGPSSFLWPNHHDTVSLPRETVPTNIEEQVRSTFNL